MKAILKDIAKVEFFIDSEQKPIRDAWKRIKAAHEQSNTPNAAALRQLIGDALTQYACGKITANEGVNKIVNALPQEQATNSALPKYPCPSCQSDLVWVRLNTEEPVENALYECHACHTMFIPSVADTRKHDNASA